MLLPDRLSRDKLKLATLFLLPNRNNASHFSQVKNGLVLSTSHRCQSRVTCIKSFDNRFLGERGDGGGALSVGHLVECILVFPNRLSRNLCFLTSYD